MEVSLMPVSDYDEWFGGNAQKAHDSMVARYGKKKGDQVFLSMVNDRKKAAAQKKSGKDGKSGKGGLSQALAEKKEQPPKGKGKGGKPPFGGSRAAPPFVKRGRGGGRSQSANRVR